jgi:hypothetical protein
MSALPQFTAEVSIYRTTREYRSAAALPFRGAAVAVEFAREFCLPRFGSCEPDPDSSTGCSRCFQRRDCELICGLPCPCPAPPPPPQPVNCGTYSCAPGQSCCPFVVETFHVGRCCASDEFCCANEICCSNGDRCRTFFGIPFCSPI